MLFFQASKTEIPTTGRELARSDRRCNLASRSSATGKLMWRQFRMTLRDRGSSPAPESLPTPSTSHRRWVDHHPRSFLVHASAQAMRRSLAPSAAPIALGATPIASPLATQRLSSALDAAAQRRTGAITSPPLMAAAKPLRPGRRFADGGRSSSAAERTPPLSDLDLRILDLLSSHRVLTQNQLAAINPKTPARTLRYRCARLAKNGLAGRSRPYPKGDLLPFISGQPAKVRRRLPAP